MCWATDAPVILDKLFLGKAIDPPQIAAMEKAWSVLHELGAVDENGKLTALGRHMVSCDNNALGA